MRRNEEGRKRGKKKGAHSPLEYFTSWYLGWSEKLETFTFYHCWKHSRPIYAQNQVLLSTEILDCIHNTRAISIFRGF